MIVAFYRGRKAGGRARRTRMVQKSLTAAQGAVKSRQSRVAISGLLRARHFSEAVWRRAGHYGHYCLARQHRSRNNRAPGIVSTPHNLPALLAGASPREMIIKWISVARAKCAEAFCDAGRVAHRHFAIGRKWRSSRSEQALVSRVGQSGDTERGCSPSRGNMLMKTRRALTILTVNLAWLFLIMQIVTLCDHTGPSYIRGRRGWRALDKYFVDEGLLLMISFVIIRSPIGGRRSGEERRGEEDVRCETLVRGNRMDEWRLDYPAAYYLRSGKVVVVSRL